MIRSLFFSNNKIQKIVSPLAVQGADCISRRLKIGALAAFSLILAFSAQSEAAPAKTVADSKLTKTASSPSIPTSRGVVDAIVLKQTSTFVGAVDLTVSDAGIRFAMTKMGIVWLSYPPKWDGFAYNPEFKNYIVRPHEEWKKKLFTIPTGKKSAEALPKFTVKDTGKRETIEGYSCHKEALISQPMKKHKPGEPTKPYCAGYIWVAEDFPAPKEVGELMSNFVRVEVNKGIVLKAEMLKAPSFTEFKPVFETLKITRKKVPASMFDPPKNLKLVSNEFQLMMGDSDSDSGSGLNSTSTDDLLKKLK